MWLLIGLPQVLHDMCFPNCCSLVLQDEAAQQHIYTHQVTASINTPDVEPSPHSSPVIQYRRYTLNAHSTSTSMLPWWPNLVRYIQFIASDVNSMRLNCPGKYFAKNKTSLYACVHQFPTLWQSNYRGLTFVTHTSPYLVTIVTPPARPPCSYLLANSRYRRPSYLYPVCRHSYFPGYHQFYFIFVHSFLGIEYFICNVYYVPLH